MTVRQVSDDTPSPPTPAGRGRRGDARALRWGAVPATAAVIIATTSVLGWRLLGAFTFMMDDLAQVDLANRFGLSSELLLMNMAQHFGPINRIAHLLELRIAGVDPTAAALVVTGAVGCLLVVTAWLTYELGLSLVRRLLVLAAAGTALPTLDTAVWNDAALHILLALIATYLMIAMHVRGIRTSRPWWHVASVLMFAVGLLVQERAALALPLAVFVDVFLLWRDDRFGGRLRRLWSVRWPLLAMTAIGAVAAYWVHANYVAPDAQAVQPVPALRTAVLALTGYQFPQLVGHQPADPLGAAGQLLALVVIVLGCAALIAMNRRNTGPIMLFGAVFALYWSFLAFSPMMNDAAILANAQRLQNGIYVTVPALIAVFSLEGPPTLSGAIRDGLSGPVARIVKAGAVCLVIIWMVLAGNSFTAENWSTYRAAHQFWAGVAGTKGAWTSPGVTVIPLQVPDTVAFSWAIPLGRQEYVLPMFASGWAPGVLTDHPVVITAGGQVADAALQVVSPAAAITPQAPTSVAGGASPGGSTGSCLLTNGENQFRVDPPAIGGPLLLRVHYSSLAVGEVTATPSFAGAVPPWERPVGLPAGSHAVLVPLPLAGVDRVTLDAGQPGPGLCVTTLEIVRPLLKPADGSCAVIDQYGIQTGERIACPS